MSLAAEPTTVKRALSAHAAIGLLGGALLYLVCLSGTVLVLYEELQRLEQPAAPEMTAIAPAAVQRGIEAVLATEADETPTTHLYVHLPSPEMPRATVTTDHQAVHLEQDGSIAVPEENGWSEVLYGLHYTLNLPMLVGITIVGALGALMLALAISGVIAHPKIFRDAFRLRAEVPGGQVLAGIRAVHPVHAQRRADAHVLLGDQQPVVHRVAGDRFDHPQRARVRRVAEVADQRGGRHRRVDRDAEALHALVEFVHRRHGFGAVVGHETVRDEQFQLPGRGFVQPQAVRAAQLLHAEAADHLEPGQREHLHPAVVAFGHEQVVAEHRHAVGPVELARAAALAADLAQALAAVGVVHGQAVARLAAGDQPGAAVRGGPGGERIEFLGRGLGRDVALGDDLGLGRRPDGGRRLHGGGRRRDATGSPGAGGDQEGGQRQRGPGRDGFRHP